MAIPRGGGPRDDEAVAGSGTAAPVSAEHGFPRLALGLAWICASVAVGVVGWILLAVCDRRADAAPGWVLIGLAILGLVAAGAVISNRRRVVTLTFSMLASATFLLGGLVAAIVAATRDNAFAADVVLIGGVPLVGAVITWPLGLRALRMSR